MKTVITEFGAIIYIGKNAKENDYLTFEFAKSGCLWFHANDVPGAHILLTNYLSSDYGIVCSNIQQAANLAALNSKDKLKPKVNIIYCDIDNIEKPKNAPAGMVQIIGDFKIIDGFPDKALKTDEPK